LIEQGWYRYTGVDTLDEPVMTTIVSLSSSFRRVDPIDTRMNQGRDLLSIYSKLVQVLYPRRTQGREVLKSILSFLPTLFRILTRLRFL
jgi:protein YIPF6